MFYKYEQACMQTTCLKVSMEARRGQLIPSLVLELCMAVTYHVIAENLTQVLCKNSKCS